MTTQSEPPQDCRRLNILREYDNPGAVHNGSYTESGMVSATAKNNKNPVLNT